MYSKLAGRYCCILVTTVLISAQFYSVFSQETLCTQENCIHGQCIDGRCQCNYGFRGTLCQSCNYSVCENGQCTEEGGCECYPGWTGSYCEMNINHCDNGDNFFGPCDNRGSVKCIDGNDTYSCICVIGYTGVNCESDIDECMVIPSPCSNHGICRHFHFGIYSCICDEGFTGSTCEVDLTPCDPNPCLDGGMCQVLTVPELQYHCVYPTNRSSLENLSLCDTLLPCENGGTCQDEEGNYTCLCSDGYGGINCSVDLDLCQVDSCLNGGSCISGSNRTSVPETEIYCVCGPEFTGPRCETQTCICYNGLCVLHPDPHCECRDGFTGNTCETEILCSNVTCFNGGTCVVMNSTSQCQCREGFGGDHCQNNECTATTCLNGGTCVERDGNFSICICPDDTVSPSCKCSLLARNFKGQHRYIASYMYYWSGKALSVCAGP